MEKNLKKDTYTYIYHFAEHWNIVNQLYFKKINFKKKKERKVVASRNQKQVESEGEVLLWFKHF